VSLPTGQPRPLLGLLGHPIRHSASPAMQEAAGGSVGLDVRYHLIEVAGADDAGLRTILDGVRVLGFAGINVTFPYKAAVVPLLDALSPQARAIGAVNTVVVADGRLTGHNTDATGFDNALARVIGVPTGPVAMVGAGGVGRAAAFALAARGTPLRLFDRDAGQAAALAAALPPGTDVRICDSVAAALDGATGLVNGTPVGMLPDRNTPVPPTLLHAGLWVADAVYFPLWTPLLLAAREAGCRVMTGRELAIDQGVDAFRLFTGREPSRDAMVAAFDAVMAARSP